MKLHYILLLLTAVSILTSCTSSRKATKGGESQPLANRELQARFQQQVAGAFDYMNLSSKVKLSAMGRSLNGQLQLEHGKRFSLSVKAPMLGFEIGRVEMDADSLTIVNKLDKVYSRTALSKLASGHTDEICVEAVECLMLGRIFVPGRGEAGKSDFVRLDWTVQDDGTMVGTYRGESYDLTYTIDGSNRLIATTLAFSGRDMKATWTYSDFLEVGKEGVLPAKEAIAATRPVGSDIEAGLVLGQPVFTGGGLRLFVPNDQYDRVSLSEMIEKFKNLKN